MGGSNKTECMCEHNKTTTVMKLYPRNQNLLLCLDVTTGLLMPDSLNKWW